MVAVVGEVDGFLLVVRFWDEKRREEKRRVGGSWWEREGKGRQVKEDE